MLKVLKNILLNVFKYSIIQYVFPKYLKQIQLSIKFKSSQVVNPKIEHPLYSVVFRSIEHPLYSVIVRSITVQ